MGGPLEEKHSFARKRKHGLNAAIFAVVFFVAGTLLVYVSNILIRKKISAVRDC